jgi:diaminohydroxyphosphoribosylaminopyrimidine deaminase/5-amino-6-(5-phosphoribosylamino)uracil reductase
MTMDGKIATTTGHSSWVTGPVARASVHQLRAKCDAVIVGGNTVRRDNPRLTTHGHSDHNPYRVVMSRQLDLPLEANLWDVQHAPTLVFTTPEANPENQKHLQQAGVNIITLEILSPKTVSAWLYNQGCSCLLWECGGDLASEAFKDGVIDKIWAFIAPKIIGGKTAPTPVGDLELTQMTQALPIERLTWRSMGEDLLIEGYLAPLPKATASKPEDKFSPG